MTLRKDALNKFNSWYAKLPFHKSSGGAAKGTIAAALVVFERLKFEFILDLEAHRAPGGSQIKGASGQAVKKYWNVLVKYDLLPKKVEELIEAVRATLNPCLML